MARLKPTTRGDHRQRPSAKRPDHSFSPSKDTYKPTSRASPVIGSRIQKRMPPKNLTSDRASTVTGSRKQNKPPSKNPKYFDTQGGYTISPVEGHLFIHGLRGYSQMGFRRSDTIGFHNEDALLCTGLWGAAMVLKRRGQRPFNDARTAGDCSLRDKEHHYLEAVTGNWQR
ncbi:hypothetical protein MMC28_003574 [Mycoblastus sanguinarius]|nr:hypothetical protein [Mycoblastus sanguinarius]